MGLHVSIILMIVMQGFSCAESASVSQRGAMSPPPVQSHANIIDNRSRIEATVIAIRPMDANMYQLSLHVDQVGPVEGYPASLAQMGDTILTVSNYRSDSNTQNQSVNAHLAEGRQLQAGDHITAVVYKQRSSHWLLMEWKAMPDK